MENTKTGCRNKAHEEILVIAVNSPDEIPEVYYHRKCRSIFTMKKDLDRIHTTEKTESRKDTESADGGEGERRVSIRGTPSTSRVYEKVCIFCEKKDKYKKGSRTRESLTQARQLRTDTSVRNAAELKMDSRVLALLSRELIAAEAHYHRSCYRQYTNISSASGELSTEQDENTTDESYANAEGVALAKLFDYIKNDMFVNKSIVELSKLNEMLKAFMLDSRIEETKPSTSKHLRRKLENEFKDTLHIIQTESNKVIVYPNNLTRDEVALICFKLEKEVTLLRQHPGEVGDMEVARIATHVRQSVKDLLNDQ